jgi:TRAP-type C4-dicarboxylate transport system substrate-binding protein
MMSGKNTKKPPEDRRVTVSMRNMSQWRWKAIQKLADERGLKLRAVLDQMIDDWMEKNGGAK